MLRAEISEVAQIVSDWSQIGEVWNSLTQNVIKMILNSPKFVLNDQTSPQLCHPRTLFPMPRDVTRDVKIVIQIGSDWPQMGQI